MGIQTEPGSAGAAGEIQGAPALHEDEGPRYGDELSDESALLTHVDTTVLRISPLPSATWFSPTSHMINEKHVF